ncbi:MAG: hypothetical protein WCJ39_05010 [bacterium]
MIIDQCEHLLQIQYDKSPAQADNISQLTNNARTGNKTECLKTM